MPKMKVEHYIMQLIQNCTPPERLAIFDSITLRLGTFYMRSQKHVMHVVIQLFIIKLLLKQTPLHDSSD